MSSFGNRDNLHNRRVDNDPHMQSFRAKNMLVLIKGQLHKIPLSSLVLPFLVTKVNLQLSAVLPIPGEGIEPDKDFPTFSVKYDTVELDNFDMYNTTTGQFTIPSSGWWKITYTTTVMNDYRRIVPFNTGNMTINGYIEKNGTSRHLPAVAELALIHNQSLFVDPAQEIRTARNSDVVFFSSGDTFNVKGIMIAGYDTDRQNHIFTMGNPFKWEGQSFPLDFLKPPVKDWASLFDTFTSCTVEFVRPENFLDVNP